MGGVDYGLGPEIGPYRKLLGRNKGDISHRPGSAGTQVGRCYGVGKGHKYPEQVGPRGSRGRGKEMQVTAGRNVGKIGERTRPNDRTPLEVVIGIANGGNHLRRSGAAA